MKKPSSLCLRNVAILLIAACVATAAASAADRAVVERIDQIMAGRYTPEGPGAAVIVARNGKVMFRRAYGLASVELQVPVRPEMVFGLGSVTKLFTAVAAMILVEEGALRLDDKVVDYLPKLVKTEGVTIAHLLSHTSGMTGPIAEIRGYGAENLYREITPEDLVATYADFPLRFQPGERFRYSNEGVATLALIVERAAKQSWETFLQERIFKPAGMQSTYYGGHLRIIPMAVTGYTKHDTGWKQARQSSFTRGFGMGGLFSSVDDLLALANALLAGVLVKPETLEAMFTPYPLNGGGHSRHGFGFVVADRKGHKFVGHGGGHSGISTFVAMLPDDGFFIALLTNRSPQRHRARDEAEKIITVLLGSQPEN